MMDQLLLFLFIFIAALSGYYLKLLTKSGAIAAFATGAFVCLGFGLKGLLLLGLFFASSSFWSKFKNSKKTLMESRLEKGSNRDWQQVAANGGLAAVSGLFYYFFPHPLVTVFFIISIASANADTWASEIGSLSSKRPILLSTLARVEKGTSGAVSLLGTAAAIAGSALIGIAGILMFELSLQYFLFFALFGFIGNAVDTLLGGYMQAEYRCSICGERMEKLVHCRTATNLMKGMPMMNNEMVNFTSGLMASFLGVGCIMLFS